MNDQAKAELTPAEISLAQKLIDQAKSGTYTLRKLYGEKWITIPDPNDFGTRFKQSAKNQCFKNVTIHPAKTGANAAQYII